MRKIKTKIKTKIKIKTKESKEPKNPNPKGPPPKKPTALPGSPHSKKLALFPSSHQYTRSRVPIRRTVTASILGKARPQPSPVPILMQAGRAAQNANAPIDIGCAIALS
jgi:hypothetical protein